MPRELFAGGRRSTASWAWPCPRSTAAAGSTTSASTWSSARRSSGPASAGAGLGHHPAQRHLPALLPALCHRRAEGSAGCRGIASGELITAIAMTEPGIGSRPGRRWPPPPSATATTTWSTARRRSSPTASTPTWSSPRSRPIPSQRHRGMSLLVLERGMAGLRAGPQPGEDRPARPGHRRAVLHRRAACRSANLLGERGRGLRAPGRQPAPGAPVHRRRRRGRGPRPPWAGRSTT